MKEENKVLVSVLDPAIDTESMTMDDMSGYAESRDLARLKFKPGVPVTRYHTREIRHDVMESYVMAAPTDAEKYRRAFLCGVVRVENIVQRDGSIITDWTPPSVGKLPAMPDSEAERFSAAERQEIGLCIFDRSFLAPRTVPGFRLPHTLLRYLAERAYRPVDASQASQAPSKGEASQGQAA